MSAAKKPKTYHFHEEWEEDYFFTMTHSKCVCLICKMSVFAKKGNLERHFTKRHLDYNTDYPPGSELRSETVRQLKAELAGQQATFTKTTSKAKAATDASFRVSHMLIKNKKSFQDGQVVKDAFLVAADSLFRDFKNKSEIITAVKSLQLSRNTVTRRCEMMAGDLMQQLKNDTAKCECLSLQLDESTDITDSAQLCIFIRMVFSPYVPSLSARSSEMRLLHITRLNLTHHRSCAKT